MELDKIGMLVYFPTFSYLSRNLKFPNFNRVKRDNGKMIDAFTMYIFAEKGIALIFTN